jgi:hypothetical protein
MFLLRCISTYLVSLLAVSDEVLGPWSTSWQSRFLQAPLNHRHNQMEHGLNASRASDAAPNADEGELSQPPAFLI